MSVLHRVLVWAPIKKDGFDKIPIAFLHGFGSLGFSIQGPGLK